MARDETERHGHRQHAGIAAAVRLLLVERGFSQGDLADYLKITRSSLNRSLNPDGSRPRKWQPTEIREMALFFRVPMEFFFIDDLASEYEAAVARVERIWEETVAQAQKRLQDEVRADPHA